MQFLIIVCFCALVVVLSCAGFVVFWTIKLSKLAPFDIDVCEDVGKACCDCEFIKTCFRCSENTRCKDSNVVSGCCLLQGEDFEFNIKDISTHCCTDFSNIFDKIKGKK